MIARRLQAIARIRPGEGRTAALLLALMLVGMTSAAVGANGVESLFFSRFGPRWVILKVVGGHEPEYLGRGAR
jgi:hypothetical protein